MQLLDKASEELDSYIEDVFSVLSEYAQKPEVFSYHEHNPSEKSVTARRIATENLFKELPPLSGIRIIDINGRNVHYSSYDESDVLKQNGLTKIYKNYNDIIKDSEEIDFSFLKTEVADSPRLILDSKRNRMIISQPFYWFEKYQGGNIIFYFDFISLKQAFVDRGIFSYAQEFRIFSDSDFNGGVVLELPKSYEKEFKEPILEKWTEKKSAENKYPDVILSSTDGNFWTLLTSARSKYFKVSGVWQKSSFELSRDLIWLIYVCVFITIFLVFYLLFSLSSDPVSVTKKKIRNLQLGIIQEYIAQKKEVDWNRIGEQIQFRKKDMLDSLRKDLIKKSGKNRDKIEALLEDGWNDILKLFDFQNQNRQGSKSEQPFSMDDLRRMIEEALKSVKIPVSVNAASVQNLTDVEETSGELSDDEAVAELEPAQSEEPLEGVEELDEVEDLDDVDEVEEVEDIDEVEELDNASGVEELEELDGADNVEEVEEVEEVEDLDDVDDVEDIDEVEELDSASGAEELEKLDDVDDVAELDEVAELDDVEEVEPVDDVEELEDLDDAEVIDEVEELDEASGAEELEPIDEVEELYDDEELDRAEELEEIEEVEPVEELDEVESLEEVEEISEVEPLDDVEELEEAEEIDPLDDVSPIEELPEYDEFSPDKELPVEDKKNTFYSVENVFPENNEYIEDEESFIRSERFGTVEDLFAEEIALGTSIEDHNNHSSRIMDFKITKMSEIFHSVSDLTEEAPAPKSKAYFSMTEFAKNDRELRTLPAAEPDTQVIKENNGVFQISENMDFSSTNYDTNFKSLVDSVLRK